MLNIYLKMCVMMLLLMMQSVHAQIMAPNHIDHPIMNQSQNFTANLQGYASVPLPRNWDSSSFMVVAPDEVVIGLDLAQRDAVTHILRRLLGNTFALYTKTLNYHWNVTGPFFGQLHEFFKHLYEELFATIDLLAERIRALGRFSPGSLFDFQHLSQIHEEYEPLHALSSESMLQNLLQDIEYIVRLLRSAIDETEKLSDSGTSNFLAELLVKTEKQAWMIRAHVRKIT